MKTCIYKNYGPPEVLKILQTEKPTPKPNQVLIRVYASTVNRTDCAILRAKPFIMRAFTGLIHPKRTTPGTDFAGVIEAVGSNVTSFKTNEKVFGFNDMGMSSHAEYLILNEKDNFISMPKNRNYAEAAASIEGSHYAYIFINKINIKISKKILVLGSTGAIGSAMVQLLKYYNIDVTATCEDKNADLVKSLGAIKCIDYTKEDFTKLEEQFDHVFDAVGKSTFEKCKPLIRVGGSYISSELGPGCQNIYLPIQYGV